MNKTVVGYLRVSGLGQVNLHGFARQKETIQLWASHTGSTVVRFYTEKGISGAKNQMERPAFSEMVSELLSNSCKTIVVESLDRFARDLSVQMQLLAYLKSKRIRLFNASTGDEVTELIDDDPMRKAMVQIQGVFSELDKNLTVMKLRKARLAKKMETGKCEGQKPFGFYPEEEVVFNRIKELYRKPKGRIRRSLQAIVNTLNTEKRATRTGVLWTKQVLHKVVNRGFAHH